MFRVMVTDNPSIATSNAHVDREKDDCESQIDVASRNCDLDLDWWYTYITRDGFMYQP